MECICGFLSQLVHLDVSSCHISDSGGVHVSSLVDLESLGIGGNIDLDAIDDSFSFS